MKCMYCKKEIDKDSNFCVHCGNPISVDGIAKKQIKLILKNAKGSNTDLLVGEVRHAYYNYLKTKDFETYRKRYKFFIWVFA